MPVRALVSETSYPVITPERDSIKSFFWGSELNSEKKEVQFSFPEFDEEEDDEDYLIHSFTLKQACLGSKAGADEVNVVELETKNFKEEVVKQPIVVLNKGGQMMSPLLDLKFSQKSPVILRLIEGNGPVYISAMHQTEMPWGDAEEFGLYNDTETELTEEDESPQKAIKGLKRKARTVLLKKKVKKQARSEEDEEEDEEESMEDEEAETEGTEEESEDVEEDEEEDEEEEEESPVKTKKTKKGKNTAAVKAKEVRTPKGGKKLNGSAVKKSTPRVK